MQPVVSISAYTRFKTRPGKDPAQETIMPNLKMGTSVLLLSLFRFGLSFLKVYVLGDTTP